MEARVKNGQSLLDVAIEQFGTWEAAIDLARENSIALTEDLQNLRRLLLPEKVYDRRMQLWCNNNNVSPATAHTGVNVTKAGIFTKQFTNQFI